MQADRHQHAADTDRGRGLPRPVVRSPETAGPQQAAPRLADGLSPAAALSLQRAIGNAAVARLVEQERHQHGADCGHGATVQRSTGDQAVQRDALDRVDAVTRASGSPLRTDVRHRMESDYGGEDFSDVRVHVDRDSAEAVGAKAYTTKTHHIVFRSTADMDDHTMRHELQHVRQQRAGGVPSGISAPTDAWERDAESTAAELGRRPADVQRSPAREQNRTSAPGVAVQRMPSSPSRKERGRSRSGSDCRIEARGSGSRVRVSRSSGPARSPRDGTGPTVHTYRNDDSVVRNQASVIGYRGTFTQNLGPGIRHQGPVNPDESGPTVHHYWNRRSLILDQAPVIWKQGTITHNLGPDIPSRATVTRDGSGPTTYSYENEDEVIRAQGAVENRGGLYTRNVPGSAAHAEGGDVNAANVFNLFGRRSADDPGWAQETN
ncbi:eCIS core domain-containing protein [Streptomyces longwoodensis]|uniref:eCIS core domain-containing protein n=1 Tax=Streptomyces longwoodensis TaxID=68231 RepID=UPI0033D162E1